MNLGIDPESTNSKLSARACREALQKAHMDRVDAIIHSSCTPDYPVPSTASLVQDELGMNGCAAYDIRSACCGSTQAFSIARSLLLSRTHDSILVVGMDVGSVFGALDESTDEFNRSDAVNAVMIGDGGGCCLMKAFEFQSDEERQQVLSQYSNGVLQVLHTVNRSIGVGQKPGMYLPGGGSIFPCNQHTIDKQKHKFQHDFRSVIQHGPMLYMRGIEEMQKLSGYSLADIDMIVPHQANGRLKELARGLGLDTSKLYTNFDRVGNTANGSLHICLDDIVNQNRVELKQNMRILLVSAESTKWLYGSVLLQYRNYANSQLDERQESTLATRMRVSITSTITALMLRVRQTIYSLPLIGRFARI